MIHTGDCATVMAGMPAESVDAVVTDPPYYLRFMGRKWDDADSPHHQQELHKAWATEAFRVLKPGGYLLAFGGTRTVHRLAAGIEDAGFEIRDELIWVYASGFPKSLDVSKALDRVAGVEREVVGSKLGQPGYSLADGGTAEWGGLRGSPEREAEVTAPATDLARQWEGWGTALKPAHEPIVMARKPLVGTVAGNVTRYGTGALNIDGTRIRYVNEEPPDTEHWKKTSGGWKNTSKAGVVPNDNSKGRWPSNLLLSDPELFDEPNPWVVGSGATVGPGTWTEASSIYGTAMEREPGGGRRGEDSGGYSRFFIIPKADRADREPVLRGQLDKAPTHGDGSKWGEMGINAPEMREARGVNPSPTMRENSHATVKPTDLMRHLIRLVTPPGGTVLDPFLGSGSTAIAAELEGFPWIGIEKEPEYVAIAEARLNGTQRGLGLDVPAPTKAQSGRSGWRDSDRPDGAEGVTNSFGAGSVTGRHYDDGSPPLKSPKSTADTAPLFDEEPAA